MRFSPEVPVYDNCYLESTARGRVAEQQFDDLCIATACNKRELDNVLLVLKVWGSLADCHHLPSTTASASIGLSRTSHLHLK
jgi:hypothetical protein|eukprot:COSAG02_NODE_2018_length_10094_cov_6.180990_2_plen_82_part_00